MTNRTKNLMVICLFGAVLVSFFWVKKFDQPQAVNSNKNDPSILPPPTKEFAEWLKYWEQQR